MYTYDATVVKVMHDDRVEQLSRSARRRRGTRSVLPARRRGR